MTPADEAFNTVSTSTGENADRGEREYSADVGDASAVDVALIPAGRVTVDANGIVSFEDSDPAQASNRADDLGDTDAVIESVNGVAQSSPDSYVEDVTANNGIVTFTIDSETPDEVVIPVVFEDDDNKEQLNLDENDEPSESFGIGGTKSWSAEEAAAGTSEGEVQIYREARDEFTTDDDAATPNRGNIDDDGPNLFEYDLSEDTFEYNSPGVNAFTLTDSQWEDFLSGSLTEAGDNVANVTTGNVLGDAVSVNYNPDGTSTFTVVDDVPAAADNVEADLSGGTITVTWDAPSNPDVDGYEVWRQVDPEGPANPTAWNHLTGEGSPVDGTELTDTDTGTVGEYRYLVGPFNDRGHYGPESEMATATVEPVEAEATPYSYNAQYDANFDGVFGNGDTVTFWFENAPLELGGNPTIDVIDDDGTRGQLNSSNADFTVGGSNDDQLIVALSGEADETGAAPRGDTSIDPTTLTAVADSSDIGNAAGDWNLARSGLWDDTIDSQSPLDEENQRVVPNAENGNLPEHATSWDDPNSADVTADPNSNSVSVATGSRLTLTTVTRSQSTTRRATSSPGPTSTPLRLISMRRSTTARSTRCVLPRTRCRTRTTRRTRRRCSSSTPPWTR